jgi:molybdopterin-guanine dinucleotide biosynthesis protein A
LTGEDQVEIRLYDGPVLTPFQSVTAILLGGEASKRMGQDKSRIVIDGLTLAVRTGRLLSLVVETVVEVGPGVSGLPAILEQPRGEGPLVAIAAGCRALRDQGHNGAALVIACDRPFISERLLRFLAEWDSEGSVVPVVRGRPQPLCARWGAQDLNGAQDLVNREVRSLHHLSTQPDVAYLNESVWGHLANERDFSDVDSPDDLYRLG